MPRSRFIVAPVAALALLGVGCGGSSDGDKNAEQIRSTVTTYVTAFVNKDAAKACSLLTDSAQKRLSQQAGGAGSCEKTIGQVVKAFVTPKVASQLRQIKVDSVKIDGDTATVETKPNFGGQSKPTQLKKVDGQWLVDGDAQ